MRESFQEKEIIYKLMQELIQERRELSKQYYELKERLEKLDTPLDRQSSSPTHEHVEKQSEPSMSVLEKERIKQKDHYIKNNKSAHHIPYERIAWNIASILKNSDVPMSNKQLFEKLQEEFELRITYSNLICNVLPRINEDKKIPVERAYRGYWQYRLKS